MSVAGVFSPFLPPTRDNRNASAADSKDQWSTSAVNLAPAIAAGGAAAAGAQQVYGLVVRVQGLV